MKKLLKILLPNTLQIALIAVVVMFWPSADFVAMAVPTAASAPLSTTDFITNLVQFLSTGLQIIQQLLWPILLLIGPLLDNNLIFGPGVEDRLFEIWSQMRNITSLILAIMLVAVALINIFGASEGSTYELKSFLKKMVITLVTINFTFFGARVILDASNVLTNFAFGLPNSIQIQSINSLSRVEKGVCSALQQVGSSADSQVFKGFINLGLAGSTDTTMCNGNTLSDAAKGFFSRITSSNLSLLMAANYSTIADGLEPSRTFEATLDIVNLSINTALSLIMVLVHALAYISLFFVLVVRLMFLWLSIALSPLIVFATIMGISQFDELKSLYDEFFTHVFAPVKVGFAMSISYIIFNTIEQTGISTPGIQLGQGLSYPFSGVETLEKLIISLASAVIVYEVALEVGSKTRASFITDKISQFARDNARTAQGLIGRIPLGAAGTGSTISLGSVSDKWKGLQTAASKAAGADPTNSSQKTSQVESLLRGGSPIGAPDFSHFRTVATQPQFQNIPLSQINTSLSSLRPNQFSGKDRTFLTELKRYASRHQTETLREALADGRVSSSMR